MLTKNLSPCLIPLPLFTVPYNNIIKLIYDSHSHSVAWGTGHLLPRQQNTMQSELDSFNEYCRLSELTINQEKSKCMLFNRARKHSFIQKLYLKPDSCLEVVEEMKLVGYQLRSDLRTISNTEYIIKRAWKRMWVVRRLKTLGASEKDLLSVLRVSCNFRHQLGALTLFKRKVAK